ncbi:MAG: CusA/CzcA family heavy metal efflux RND transporter [Planctomycetales bacterium]
MLERIITWSLGNRILILLFVIGMITAGLMALQKLNIDAFPDTTPIQVQINTTAPALVPEEVERQITFPVEMAMSGMPGLEQLRSISQFGLSQVVATFKDGTDIYFARQLINERLGTVEMPAGIPRPEMGPVSTGLGEVFHYVLMGDGPHPRDLMSLRTMQDWQVKPVLRPVAGTAEINSWGGLKKQYQVRIFPEKLFKYDLTFQQVVQAVQQNNLNVGGGNINRGGDMLLVHGIGRTTNVKQIEEIVITSKGGVPVTVRDVAEVTIGHEIRRGAITANGKGEVVLGLGFMLMGENSYGVTSRQTEQFREVCKTLPKDVKGMTVYDRTELVDQVIGTVKANLIDGALLVVAILFIFLGNLRAGLIVAAAIPLSMLCAFMGMQQTGIAGSLLSLGALDFGLVVDGSVVMIENVIRRLSHGSGEKPRQQVIRDACIEVAKPSVFGVFIIMIVYLPILTLEGVEGKMFRPMALTVVYALAGALVVSLTVIPVLANLVLPAKLSETEPLIVRLASRLYAPLLHRAMKYPIPIVVITLGMLVAAGGLATRLGSEFVPRLAEGSIVIGILRPPGTSLEQSVLLNTQMEQVLLEKFPDEVSHVWSRQGAPEVVTDPGTIESTDVFISLKPRAKWTKAKNQTELVTLMEVEMKQFIGQTIWFTQPIEMRINEMLSGARADVAVKLFGDDFDVLTAKGKEIEKVLRSIPGSTDLTTEQILGQPVLQIRLDQDQIARYGVSAQMVLDVVEAIGGKAVGEVLEDQLRFPLTVRLPEQSREDEESIKRILIATPSGEQLPLERLATIKEVFGARTISREWSKRRITIQCNIRGRDMGGFVKEAQEKIAKEVKLPETGYRIVWSGQFENLERASARLQLVVPLALALIFILLYFTFQNIFDSALVFTSVPFACIGGIISLWVRDMPFSISAAVGFIALSGISVLNSLVLVEFIRHLNAEGHPLRESIEEAGLTRLRPVLMTALVASLGFLPMALSTTAGAEIQRPLATVVIGGLVTSTLLTSCVVPAIYPWFVPRGAEEKS